MLLAAVTTGCSIPRTAAVTETERALCEAWGGSLPTRSRADTARTRIEVGMGYDAFLAACDREALPSALSAPEKMGPSAGGTA